MSIYLDENSGERFCQKCKTWKPLSEYENKNDDACERCKKAYNWAEELKENARRKGMI